MQVPCYSVYTYIVGVNRELCSWGPRDVYSALENHNQAFGFETCLQDCPQLRWPFLRHCTWGGLFSIFEEDFNLPEFSFPSHPLHPFRRHCFDGSAWFYGSCLLVYSVQPCLLLASGVAISLSPFSPPLTGVPSLERHALPPVPTSTSAIFSAALICSVIEPIATCASAIVLQLPDGGRIFVR